MDDVRIPTTEQLVAEMGWVRRLARALVKDAAVADDVAQDTWLVAAQRRPDADRPLRPWLARVVINLVRTRRTSEARRERREAAVDDDRGVPTPDELVERVELQRAVADEVIALAEPYRSTVLLHFFEGYSSAEIARRLGIPEGTVRRRLKVALEQLRDAFRKRSDPPKRGWLAALIPLARLPGPTPASAAIGAVAMKKVIGVVVVLLLLLLLGAGTLWRHHARSDGPAGRSTASVADHQLLTSVGAGSTRTSVIPEWIIQPGAPPRHIAGHVMFHDTPVAGAKVVLGLELFGEATSALVMPDSAPNLLQPVAEVTSASDGSFDFGVQPAAIFTVSASASDHSAAALRVDNTNPRSHTDRLLVALGDCRSRLFGMVADASGGGIVKARISAAGLSGTESDAAGKYSLCLAPRDALGTPSAQVRVEADGYGTISQTVIVTGDLHHDFLLVPEAVLVGRVVTSAGEPVAGARVIASAEPSELPRHLASGWADSDSDGRFRIAGLAPGAFQLRAAAMRLTMKPIAVVARPGTTSREIRVVLTSKPLARVRGHVFVKGAPASGIMVMAVQGRMPAGTSLSQADGSFVLDGIPYGTTSVFAPPDQPDASKQVEIASPLVDDVRVDLTHAASVHGRVTRHGKGVAGADIMYMPAPQATIFGLPPAARTDASGAFTLELPVGVGQLAAWDDAGKAFATPQPIEITSTDDKSVEIELDCSGEVLGTVVDQTGAAVPGVYVRLDRADGSGDMCESMTDASGRFDCAMLIGGEYRATVAPSPGARQGFAPATGDHFDTIHVPRTGTVTGIQLAIKDERLAIRGTVVDDTGSPIPDVHIEAIARGEATMDSPSTLSDANGQFELGNLARGTYTLGAHAADGSEGQVPDVAAGATAVSIKLDRAGAIEGTLTGFTTTPDVFVMSSRTTGRGWGARALVDGSSFSRIGVPPGRYTVVAVAGADADGQAIEIQPGETAHVDLQSRGVGSVEGTVSELAAHAPVSGMRCDPHVAMDGQMSPVEPDASQQAFTDAAGHFVVNAPVGRVRIFCFSLNGGPLSPAGTDVDVVTGARANVNVFSVRATSGSAPGDVGFAIAPGVLPLTVAQVAAAGPAAAAGLRPGDQLIAIDGASLQGVLPEGATVLLANHRAGTPVTLEVSRGGVLQTMKFVVAARQ